MAHEAFRPSARAFLALLPLLAFSSPVAADPHDAGDGWNELAPPARTQHAAAFDTKRRRMIVFGGQSDLRFTPRSDVWVLETRPHTAWQWLAPRGTCPEARAGACAIFDERRDRVLVFGGSSGDRKLGDLWELSLRGRAEWRRIPTTGPAPEPRTLATLTLDPLSDRAILIGGYADRFLSDVWALSLERDPRWSAVIPTGQPPRPRAGHAAVPMPERGEIAVVGGAPGGVAPRFYAEPLRDVWVLSTRGTASWRELAPSDTSSLPCGLQGHGLSYDPERGRLIAWGGERLKSPCRESSVPGWSFSLVEQRWTALDTLVGGPRIRGYGALLPGRDAGQWMLYGGGARPQADSWRLDLHDELAWSPLHPSIPGWSRIGAAVNMVMDPENSLLIAIRDRQVWTRDMRSPGGGEWTAREADGPLPCLLSDAVTSSTASLAYDPVRHRVIAHVRCWSRESRPTEVSTWALTLGAHPRWEILTSASETPTIDAPILYDPARDELMLLGHESGVWDEWKRWTLALGWMSAWEDHPIEPLPKLADRIYYSPLIDSRRDAVLVFGGSVPNLFWDYTRLNDTWAMPLGGDGAWELLSDPGNGLGAPPSRVGSAVVLDPDRDRLLVFGGVTASYRPASSDRDTWEFALETRTWRPFPKPDAEGHRFWLPEGVLDPGGSRVLVVDNESSWELPLPSRRAGMPERSASPLTAAGGARHSALELLTPNPTTLGWSAAVTLPDAGAAALQLHDLAGRLVWESAIGRFGAGRHVVAVADGARLNAGVYFLRLTSAPGTRVLKLVRLE